MMGTMLQSLLMLAFLLVCQSSLSHALGSGNASYHTVHRRQNLTLTSSTLSFNTTEQTLSAAEALVIAAVKQQGEYNAYRAANPRRNTWVRPVSQASTQKRDEGAPKPPTLNATLLAAAAMIAERDAASQAANGTTFDAPAATGKRSPWEEESSFDKRASNPYWLPQLANKGLAPMGYNNSYPVFRDVTAYGAKGDGLTDDTAAINRAIADGGNCGSNCLSSSVKGTLIYFPAGTYLISSPINAYYYSQLVGDATNRPTIKTSANFIGTGAIQTDVYIDGGNGAEWYVPQSNFYRQVRNFIIDIRGSTTDNMAAFHWQVAQATSVQNIAIYASTASNNTQMGFATENGSGGFMSRVAIYGGAYGIWGGNQQYTIRDFVITGQTKACISIIWDWGWTWSRLFLANAPVGIQMLPLPGDAQNPGAIYVMDSTFQTLAVGVWAEYNKTVLDQSIITLDNCKVNSVKLMVAYANGNPVKVPDGDLDFLVIGDVEDSGSQDGYFTKQVAPRPPGLTTSDRFVRPLYYTRDRPQYEGLSTSNIINVKICGAKGDGVSDDTRALQNCLAYASTSNLVYFPAGTYVITSTLNVSASTRITGSIWSQLAAKGPWFDDTRRYQPMLRVGNPGDVGVVEISDMLFTSIGPLRGLIMVEWNIKSSSQGSAAMWDCHFRLGGAIGTNMQLSQCPYQGKPSQSCWAAELMLHVTSSGDGYFENVWAWAADHDIDDPQNQMVSILSGRGILIESQSGPVWLYGTASEHSMLYQYNFNGATNVFAGMIQTESPYFQNTQYGSSPGFFAYTSMSGDPVWWDGSCNGTQGACGVSWAVLMQQTTNLTIAGAGLYSWFGNYGQDCIDSQNCQQRMVLDDGSNQLLQIWNLITIGATEMISSPSLGLALLAKDFTQAIRHPFWSALAGYLDSSEPEYFICDEDDPGNNCPYQAPPCDFSHNYTSFEAMAADSSVPNECLGYYTMDTFQNVLQGSLNNYTDVNDGYDEVWSYYETYMRQAVSSSMQQIMETSTSRKPQGGDGNAFFDCIWSQNGGKTTRQQCPIPHDSLDSDYGYNLEYVLTNSSGFYNLLATKYAINSSWVYFKDSDTRQDAGCGPSGHIDNGNDCIHKSWHIRKQPAILDGITIPNPKDVVTKALPNVGFLMNNMLGRKVDITTGMTNQSLDDLAQVYSVPVLMLQSAVDSMANAKAIGQQQEQEEQIKLLFEVLAVVFAVMPFLDELAPELELVDGFFTIVATVGGTAASAAQTIQGIVANPGSAPMLIFEFLLSSVGGVRLRDDSAVASLAKGRRDLTTDQGMALGEKFQSRDKQFQSTLKQRCML